MDRDWVNRWGLDLSKEVLWVSVCQRAAKLQAVKVGDLKKILPRGPPRTTRVRPGFDSRTIRSSFNFDSLYCHISLTIYFEIKVKVHFEHLSIVPGAQNRFWIWSQNKYLEKYGNTFIYYKKISLVIHPWRLLFKESIYFQDKSKPVRAPCGANDVRELEPDSFFSGEH